jgi:hypothetical protein
MEAKTLTLHRGYYAGETIENLSARRRPPAPAKPGGDFDIRVRPNWSSWYIDDLLR